MSSEQKQAFERAAIEDGTKNVSAWLRWLAERRIDEQRGNGSTSAEPAPATSFIPGFGLEED